MKIIKKIIFILFILLIIGVSFGLVVINGGYQMYSNAIQEVPLDKKVQSIRAKKNYAKIEEVPQMYKNAVIAVEDHRFYQHNGIDVIAISRAIINDIKNWDFVEGGSTITQQLAKNIYFTQDKKINRKFAETFMAFNIEKNYSKNEILELYINTSYFGDGYYTVKEACKGYFGKELSEMTDYECIMLAGIPNAPSIYSPTKNPDLAKQRQKQVMDKMIKYNYLTSEKAANILKQK